MTPLAPPTEAEVKALRAWAIQYVPGHEAGDVLALCDAYLAQREALEKIAKSDCVRNIGGDCVGLTYCPRHIARAALSAAPLEDKT